MTKASSCCHGLAWIIVAIQLLLLAIVALCLYKSGGDLTKWMNKDDNETSPDTSFHTASYHKRIVSMVNKRQKVWEARYNPLAEDCPKCKNLSIPRLAQDVDQDEKKNARNNAESEYIRIENSVFLRDADRLPADYLTTAFDDSIPPPLQFDARDAWPQCWTIRHVFDQGGCGSCWAAASSSSMSDRTCIHSNGTLQPQLSVDNLLRCCELCGQNEFPPATTSCRGSSVTRAFHQWITAGIVTGGDFGSYAGCQPYQFDAKCGHPCGQVHYHEIEAVCNKKCLYMYPTPYERDKYYGAWYFFSAPDLDQVKPPGKPKKKHTYMQFINFVKREIQRNGPVTAAYFFHEDVQHYHKGIYNHVVGERLIGHLFKVIGWGRDQGHDYWLISNTWGRDWGELGFGRLSINIHLEAVAFGMPRL